MPQIINTSRPRTKNELHLVVRPLTLVNSRLDTREVQRTIVTWSDRSARQGATMTLAIRGPHVPLMVHGGGAGNMLPVFRPCMGLKARTM